MDSLNKVLAEIASERRRQDAKWGDQSSLADAAPSQLKLKSYFGYKDHPEWIGQTLVTYYNADSVSQAQKLCQDETDEHGGTWAGVAAEEFFEWLEAMGISHGEGDMTKVRTEAIQVAAVMVAFIEALDKRGLKDSPQQNTEVEND